ncbi:BglG family transcription antiterminator [Peptacetobacter hiranonis]|uniref:PRD domain protein n=1 Tax=Peptacetobacter hiranonis (strain DSM 13275 / JCM 10541 / KCTC 15199 / TO-931) TaxID=500633 RepID=B6FXG1_PEPHT|nr:BglG family transcription antiterminator [Peptacetobacter hiranonis]EEA85811.1 PRD domain protein [Peptacetobacter hiranonis DSM 13275]QEK20596.1 Transcriptional regulator ManR [Peptacetobacter hiranonis]
MITLNERQNSILKYLYNKKDYTTINEISKEFKVSVRTIRYDLDNIEYMLKDNDKISLVRTPRYGIKLEFKGKRDILTFSSIFDCVEINSPEDRVIFIAINLLIGNSKVEELANMLSISKNTVVSDLKKAKEILNNLRINVISKAYVGTCIEGDEEDVRYAFINLYYKISNADNYKLLKMIIDDFDSVKNDIEERIHKVENKLSLEYSDTSFKELIIIIMYCFMRMGEYSNFNYSEEYIHEKEQEEEFEAIQYAFADKTEDKKEICYLMKWFKSAKVMSFINDKSDVKMDGNKYLAMRIIEDMEKYTGIDYSNDFDFVNSVVMHFSVAMYRMQNNFKIENPLKEDIKMRLGIIYQITEDVMKKYESEIGVEFPDDEVSYMAMHFGAAFERKTQEIFDTKALIVCNSGLATAGLLSARMEVMLPQIQVEGVCRLNNLEEELKNKDVDIIISTVPIRNTDIEYVEVNPMLNIDDVLKLKKLAFNNVYEKSSEYLVSKYKGDKVSSVAEIIKKSNAAFLYDADNWRDTIAEASKPLIKSGAIKEEYVDDMIKAIEDLGTYMVFIPEIAFVHASNKNVVNNAVSMLTLKNEIYFGDNSEVRIKSIVVLANKDENKNLIELINILTKNNNAEKFKNAEKYFDLKIMV